MKKILILLTFSLFMACNDNSKINGNNDYTNEVIEVELAVEALNQALIDPQNTQFDDIVTHGLSYGHSSGNIQNKEEFVDDLKNGPFNFQEINISDQSIDVFNRTAIVRHVLSAKANNAGKPVEIKIGIYLVFQKVKNNWKLRGRQAYKL